jgi:hypothetical protein
MKKAYKKIKKREMKIEKKTLNREKREEFIVYLA